MLFFTTHRIMAEPVEETKLVDSKPTAKPTPKPVVPKAQPLENDVRKLDLRVGLIVSCKLHPDADSLYVEEIDVGEEVPRTVVSGLAKHIPLEKMVNQRLIVVCNMKPAALRGIKSHAMVICGMFVSCTFI